MRKKLHEVEISKGFNILPPCKTQMGKDDLNPYARKISLGPVSTNIFHFKTVLYGQEIYPCATAGSEAL